MTTSQTALDASQAVAARCYEAVEFVVFWVQEHFNRNAERPQGDQGSSDDYTTAHREHSPNKIAPPLIHHAAKKWIGADTIVREGDKSVQ
jgi:hypothetical protein